MDAYLDRECQRGCVIHFLITAVPALSELTTSPIGGIPKRRRLNKWHLIVGLSSPKTCSINDAINSSLWSCSYSSIDNAVQMLPTLGRSAVLAKMDLKDAYRVVPVHPQDCPLLGMHWKEGGFLDCALPFGLYTTPKIFSALADGLLLMIHRQGFKHSLHYILGWLFVPRSTSLLSLWGCTTIHCSPLQGTRGAGICREKPEDHIPH